MLTRDTRTSVSGGRSSPERTGAARGKVPAAESCLTIGREVGAARRGHAFLRVERRAVRALEVRPERDLRVQNHPHRRCTRIYRVEYFVQCNVLTYMLI